MIGFARRADFGDVGEGGGEKLVEPLTFLRNTRRRLLDQQHQKLHRAEQPEHFVALGKSTAVEELPIILGADFLRKRGGNAVDEIRFSRACRDRLSAFAHNVQAPPV